MSDAPFFVGIGKVYLRLRHVKASKDKRQITDPILQKLKNKGFSAIASGATEDLKTSTVCFSYSSHTTSQIEEVFNQALTYFLGDFEIVSKQREILDFTDMEMKVEKLSEELEYKYDEDD